MALAGSKVALAGFLSASVLAVAAVVWAAWAG
jgi:hypothetical protein